MMNSNRLGCYCTAGKTNFERYFVMQIFVQNWFFLFSIENGSDRWMSMKIEKVINNNVVSAVEENGTEVAMSLTLAKSRNRKHL